MQSQPKTKGQTYAHKVPDEIPGKPGANQKKRDREKPQEVPGQPGRVPGLPAWFAWLALLATSLAWLVLLAVLPDLPGLPGLLGRLAHQKQKLKGGVLKFQMDGCLPALPSLFCLAGLPGWVAWLPTWLPAWVVWLAGYLTA